MTRGYAIGIEGEGLTRRVHEGMRAWARVGARSCYMRGSVGEGVSTAWRGRGVRACGMNEGLIVE